MNGPDSVPERYDFTRPDGIKCYAIMSRDGKYRYTLGRQWDHTGDLANLVVCGVNPSTADHIKDDPTIRKDCGFAKRWGFGGLIKINVNALRSTDPKVLITAAEPEGRYNLNAVERVLSTPGTTVLLAWGGSVQFVKESRTLEYLRVMSFNVDLVEIALGLTKTGEPIHTLYANYALTGKRARYNHNAWRLGRDIFK